MRLVEVLLDGHRSVDMASFEAGPFTVLFGKNNAGKTNLLEAIYGAFGASPEKVVRRTHSERSSRPVGRLLCRLDDSSPFDTEVRKAIGASLASRPVAFAPTGVVDIDTAQLAYLEDLLIGDEEFDTPILDAPAPRVLAMNWEFAGLHERVEQRVAELAATVEQARRGDSCWLESTKDADGNFAYRVPEVTKSIVERVAALATDLLPDFVAGNVSAHVTASSLWERMPKVLLEYSQLGATQCSDLVDAAGSGAARWMTAAVELALILLGDDKALTSLRDRPPGWFSGTVLLIDEPEAHLHPAAVSSILRWCHRMVRFGFTVMVATHHEEFLRAAGDDVTLVHVTRDKDLVSSVPRTVPSSSRSRLRELSDDVGLHPAVALSLYKAMLFVEGPLDEAMIDEWGGIALDAAGVRIVPIHGTKNLEGLVTAEVVTELGIRTAILTDATVVETMRNRSSRKRSSEESKLLKLLDLAERNGVTAPTVFGVPEADLLFAIPEEVVRVFLNGPFPGWKELVQESRASEGAGPEVSVNWKQFADQQYGLNLQEHGVRSLVRFADLSGAEIPSLMVVLADVIAWASEPPVSPEGHANA